MVGFRVYLFYFGLLFNFSFLLKLYLFRFLCFTLGLGWGFTFGFLKFLFPLVYNFFVNFSFLKILYIVLRWGHTLYLVRVLNFFYIGFFIFCCALVFVLFHFTLHSCIRVSDLGFWCFCCGVGLLWFSLVSSSFTLVSCVWYVGFRVGVFFLIFCSTFFLIFNLLWLTLLYFLIYLQMFLK